MRKHRLYGVVLAMLLGAGVFTQLPISNHVQTNQTKSTTNSAGPILGLQLTSLRRWPGLPGPKAPGSSSHKHKRTALTSPQSQLLRPYSKSQPAPGTSEVRDPFQIGWAARLLALEAAAPAPAAPTAQSASYSPAPAAQSASYTPPAAQSASYTPPAPPTPAAPSVPSPSGDVWAQLRQCESNDNYTDDTGNGYYGAYQFSMSTWQSLGYSGLPSDAPPAEQDQAAQTLQATSGWGQWPACSRQLGLA